MGAATSATEDDRLSEVGSPDGKFSMLCCGVMDRIAVSPADKIPETIRASVEVSSGFVAPEREGIAAAKGGEASTLSGLSFEADPSCPSDLSSCEDREERTSPVWGSADVFLFVCEPDKTERGLAVIERRVVLFGGAIPPVMGAVAGG